MIPFRRSLRSVLTLTVFLALIALSGVLYGGNEEKRAELEQNPAWQKTGETISGALGVVQIFTNFSMGKRTETVRAEHDYPEEAAESWWEKTRASLKREWDEGRTGAGEWSDMSFDPGAVWRRFQEIWVSGKSLLRSSSPD